VTNQTFRNPRWLRSSRPPVIQPDRAWEFGLPFHPWIRLDADALGFDAPMVMFDVAELLASGYTPQALGMQRVGEQDDPLHAPVVPIVVDLKSRYDIDLYEADPVTLADPVFMLGGVFEDAHSDSWWDQVHRDSKLLLLAGDTPSLAAATQHDRYIDVEALMLTSYLGRAAEIGAWGR
jgi:hypothetical protein